jgi:hypothetical protein
MKISTPLKWTIATLAGFRGCLAAAGRGGAKPWKATSGKADAQLASANAQAAIMPTRPARSRQTPPGPITAILGCKRFRDYPSAGGKGTL